MGIEIHARMEGNILPVSLAAYQFWVFDFDNTLIKETDFLFPAYEAVAKKLFDDGASRAEAGVFLKETFLLAAECGSIAKVPFVLRGSG